MATQRGRKAAPPITAPKLAIAEEVIEAEVHAAGALGNATLAYTDARDELNQWIGQIQSSSAFSGLSKMVTLQRLKQIKDSKLYRVFKGKTGVDRLGQPIENLGTWEGFCRSIGMSVDKVDENLLNFEAFGAEALENLVKIGIGYRDLRQYRKLPTDQKAALIEVAKTGDKDGFLDLAETLIERHQREKADLQRQVDEANKDLAATELRLSTLAQQRDEAEGAAARRALMSQSERLAEHWKTVDEAAQALWLNTMRLRSVMKEALELDPCCAPRLAGQLKQRADELRAIGTELGLPEVSDIPEMAAEYLRWQAAQGDGGDAKAG
ncbi:hypothetical protein [Rubrivivax gelatinosus]|uniref:hypothetical protein n=1 Tax=Rubrivivax gelatinosus TaxID=28068 RepID=UPI001906A6C5|nr:hypothetical protein [Rubrivivax gelatinosus]